MPLKTKSKSAKHGKSSLRFSGGHFKNIFYISISTSNPLTSSTASECNAFVILWIHLIKTLMYCLSSKGNYKAKSAGIASLSSWNKETREVVKSLLLSSRETIFWDSRVISFCSILWFPPIDWVSSRSFSWANALSKKFKRALYTSTLKANKTSSFKLRA